MTTTETSVIAPAKKASLWHRLYHGETTFDFVGRRKIGFIISGVLILLSLTSLFTRGLNLGLDFEGGVSWEVPAGNGFTVSDASAVLKAQGIDPTTAKVQELRGSDGRRIRIQVAAQTQQKTTDVRNAMANQAGVEGQAVSTSAVSPTWGNQITRKAIRALVIFLIAIGIYITFRFEWKMAVGALVAVVHDVLISVGVYSILQWEVTPPTVIAFLTILGFSLYDTVVVFDKVHENTKRLSGGRVTYSGIVNLSMNQVLMRSLNTSIAALLPVISLLVIGSWFMGAIALRDFALALAVGLFVGSYSSIFVATPILAILKEREPRYRRIRERNQGRSSDAAEVRAEAAVGGPDGTGAPKVASKGAAPAGATATTVKVATPTLTHPPRPRKKKRR